MGIVCRPILLYNEFLPAEIKGERNWDYQAFGHHDGISIGKPIILENAKNFEGLFDAGIQYELEESVFTQVFWGFHENVQKEADFCADNAPFIYIVLLQISNEKGSLKEFTEGLESIQEQCDKGVSVLFYHSMDNSDLIMVVKSQSADAGFDVVNKLHYGSDFCSFKIRNTYSILGVRRTVIDNDITAEWKDEKIALLELQIIEKERGAVKALYQILEEKLKQNTGDIFRKIILGTEDDAIFIRDLPWGALLPFYRKETGILCNSNEIAQQYAYAISARVMMKEEYGTLREGGDCANDHNPEKPVLKSPFCDKLAELVREESDKGGILFPTEKKNLLMLINAFRRFECKSDKERPFTDYNFFPLFLPFYQFIKLAKIGRQGASEYYYHFMKCMKLCTQNFTKPERIYSQITDFNLKYFDMPIKFVTLYNAYIYSIKQVLNGKTDLALEQQSDTSYEFMICAGLNDNTEVKELFPRQDNDTRRLFLVETPERQMYQPKLMFFVLGHEVAHFVGKKIRNRKERMNHIIKICSRLISLAIKSYYEYGEELDQSSFDNENWKRLESELEGWIRFYLERNQKKKYYEEAVQYKKECLSDEDIEANVKFNSKYAWHSDVLKGNLVNAVKEMLASRGREIFSFVIADEFENIHDEQVLWEKFYQTRERDLRKYLDAFIGVSVNIETSLTIDTSIEKALYLLKECYADIICILMLKVSFKDYIESFLSALEPECESVEDIYRQDMIITRIALVMAAMIYPLKEASGETEYFRWDNSEYLDYDRWPDNAVILQDKVVMFFESYIANERKITAEELITKPGMVFCDQPILLEISRYLLECVECFYKYIGVTEESKKDLMRTRDFYRMSNMQCADEFFCEMMLLLKEYENSVNKEIDKVLTEENHSN